MNHEVDSEEGDVKKLHLSKDLALPYEAVTQTFALLAMRGVGKTHAASVFAEELCKAGLPFRVIEPTGAWYGLRASADGKGPGYPVTVLGGDHGDIPLEETSGKLIASLSVEEVPHLILDVSHFSKSAMRRFVADFAEEIYRTNRVPLHLIFDEADAFAPQRPRPDEMRMLGAIDDIVRRGRIRGLGCTLVTQRSAVINKDVLTQMEVLVALRTAHPRDRAPVLEWMKVHASAKQLAAVEESLASLPKGDAWIMSAGWLDLFTRVHFRQRETFNSSATPAPGERRIEPRKLAEVDLQALQAKMAATIEKAKASDPGLLRRRIGELEAEARKRQAAAPPAKEKCVEVPVLTRADLQRLSKVVERMGNAAASLAGLTGALREATGAIVSAVKLASQPPVAVRLQGPTTPARHQMPAPAPRRSAEPRPESNGAPSAYALGLLQTLAQRHPMRVTRGQLAVLSGRSGRSSAFAAAAAEILRAGLVRQEGGGLLTLTDEGMAAAGGVASAPASAHDLQETWRRALPAYERGLLEVLLASHPAGLPREELAQRSGKSLTSSAFAAAVASLRKNGLAEIAGGEVRVAETLFLAV